MTTLQVEYFMEAARRGNFTDAARSLYVAQPAVTKQIVEFEKELGFPLFRRKSRGVELTRPGELMFRTFVRFEKEYTAALRTARKLHSGSEKVAVGLLSSTDLYAVSSVINAFLGSHQEVSMEFRRLSTADIYTALERREIDLAIVIDTSVPGKKHFGLRRLFPSHDFLLTAKDSPLARKQVLELGDLENQHLIKELFPSNIYPSKFGPQLEVCRSLGFKEENIIFCNNFESCLTAVEYGNGVMIIDGLAVFPNKQNFCLIDTGLAHYISVAWCESGLNRIVGELVEWLSDSADFTT